jgi:ubiquinone biosynthesis protein
VSEIRANGWPGVGWLMRLLDGAAHAGVRFRLDLPLFRKSYFTLEGVVSDLCGRCAIEGILIRAILEQLIGEWPTRWLAPESSREFPTHLSNIDLAQMAASLPMMLSNWWLGLWQSGSFILSARSVE